MVDVDLKDKNITGVIALEHMYFEKIEFSRNAEIPDNELNFSFNDGYCIVNDEQSKFNGMYQVVLETHLSSVNSQGSEHHLV